MKYTCYSPRTKKEYSCENDYDFEIQEYRDLNGNLNYFDDEVIDYVISLKNQIINRLDKNNSNSDEIKVEHIKWFEKYLKEVHDHLIQHNVEIHPPLENLKPFKYSTSKKSPGRPKRSQNKLTAKKYDWIRRMFERQKNESLAHTRNEHAKRIRSILKTKPPEFWDKHIYSIETIKDIIKKRKWGD